MKIAISNIAWQINEESSIAELMQELGIKGVEVAPTKIWQNPLNANDNEILEYRNFWQNRGIEIVAMQSLLFGKNDLTIFESQDKRQETISYLSAIIELASKLGAKRLVFGSPKNRRIENLDIKAAEEIAIDFFYRIGEVANKHDLVFCIEPNPTVYGCDFITNSQQGLDLVNRVNSNGFGLHLDAAGMTLSEENIKTALKNSINRLCHFHISEPYLEPVKTGVVDHALFAQTLVDLNYEGWKSIEMKAQYQDTNILVVKKALETAIALYNHN